VNDCGTDFYASKEASSEQQQCMYWSCIAGTIHATQCPRTPQSVVVKVSTMYAAFCACSAKVSRSLPAFKPRRGIVADDASDAPVEVRSGVIVGALIRLRTVPCHLIFGPIWSPPFLLPSTARARELVSIR